MMDNDERVTREGSTSRQQSESRLAIFHQHRGLLLSIAYRMLGSWADAEDILQETFLRWQQTEVGEIAAPRSFLVTIVSRLCINHLQSAQMRRETYFGEWLPEPLPSESVEAEIVRSERIEGSLSLAFLLLLERLTPVERAVFLLREVFDYDYDEVARILELNEANCRQILRRARQHISQMRPRFDASIEERETMLAAFLKATSSGDLNALVALLSETAALRSDGGGKAPALPQPVYGPHNVARAILGGMGKFVPKNLVSRMVSVNGQPGVASYLDGSPYSVVSLDVSGGLIQNVYIITNPEKLARFEGLSGVRS
jgi:RNA polymerase sigma-70 factor (ECF subfamily)